MLTDTDKPIKCGNASEFREHNIDTAVISETANSTRFLATLPAYNTDVLTFSYPFDTDAVSLWRQWVQLDRRVMHGMDPDFMLPFLAIEETPKDALLIMALKNGRCQLAVVVVPGTSPFWPSQSWQLFTHVHIDVNGFIEEKAGQTYDTIFDLVNAGLLKQGTNLSRLSFSNMQCLQHGQRKFSLKCARFNAFFDLSGPATYSVPGKLNRNIRRCTKKLIDCHGPLTLKVAPSRMDNMQTFFDIEASGWKNRENSAIRSDDRLCRAYLAAARDDNSPCRAHVFTLCAGNQAVSSAYGLVYADHISLLKIGFDERFALFSPGTLLISEVIQHARTTGRTKVYLNTYPDWAKHWKPSLRTKENVHIFSNDNIGRYRYLFDRFVTRMKQLVKKDGRLDSSS